MTGESYKQDLMDELTLESQIENIKAKASMNRVANVSYPKAPAPNYNNLTEEHLTNLANSLKELDKNIITH